MRSTGGYLATDGVDCTGSSVSPGAGFGNLAFDSDSRRPPTARGALRQGLDVGPQLAQLRRVEGAHGGGHVGARMAKADLVEHLILPSGILSHEYVTEGALFEGDLGEAVVAASE